MRCGARHAYYLRTPTSQRVLSFKQILIHALRSDAAVKAAHYAASITPNAVFHVVSVIPTHRSRYPLNSLLTDVFRRAAEEAVHEVELALMGRGVLTVRKALLAGRPAEELLKYVRRYGIDLIVLTASPASGSPGRLAGSVAREVADASPKPVLICMPGAPPPPGRVSRIATYIEAGARDAAGRAAGFLRLAEGPVSVKLACVGGGEDCLRVERVLRGLGNVARVDAAPSGRPLGGGPAEVAEAVAELAAGCEVLTLCLDRGFRGYGEAVVARSPVPTALV